ncbi:hypothetical protein EW145_g4780 [Phellinidium pouzarii]|uniref:TOG domain-containing protein n=1 Tax=Phellinidium pouzarii TaxID=167371 RepID=A0A4S4L2B2_9AGAM|nr:hypothetical protein EW145_g4780 [Phellinidium pouzarii]
MGIIVSWINAIWSPHDALSHLSHSPDRRSLNPAHSLDNPVNVDLLLDDAVSLSPLPSPSSSQLPSAPTTFKLDPSAPLSPVSPAPPPHVTNMNQLLFVSSDFDERARSPNMASSEQVVEIDTEAGSSIDASDGHPRDPVPKSSSVVNRTSAPSPPPPAQAGLRIDVAAANSPAVDRELELVDANFVTSDILPDPSADMCFDDDGLTALEKIYLFARSSASFHRAFIARSLSEFLPDAIPSEAVEYVIPLMNGLAMDEDEAVKEALVEDLVSSIWWFLTHCQVVDFEVSEEAEPRDVPFLYVQSFTPLLGTLLLNTDANVGAPARRCVVDLLMRIREADAQSDKATSFGPEERRLFERELIQQVVIGMAHLDSGSLNDPGGQANDLQSMLEIEDIASYSSAVDTIRTPPPSATVDEGMLSTLTSTTALAVATEQFLAEQTESTSPDSAALAAAIQRPPSPLPIAFPQTSYFPVRSEIEPEFSHVDSQPPPTAMTSVHSEEDLPMVEVKSTSERDLESGQARKPVTSSLSQLKLETPLAQPQHLLEFNASTVTSDDPQFQSGGDVSDLGGDFNEEQAAIGRLASMSLTAAVTASVNIARPGQLDYEYELAFVREVERASRDSLYWVRREATFALGALAKVVPEEILHLNLLPLFEFFCEDSVWNVRQSILFALPAVLSRLPSEMRRRQALRTILKLAGDPASQVRTGVLEVLGETIYSFSGDPRGPPEEIVKLFIGEEGRDWHAPESPTFDTYNSPQSRTPWANSMMRARISSVMSSDNFGRPSYTSTSSSSSSDSSTESNPARPLVCAFNLPAVILTLGPTRWSELRGLHFFLSRTGASKVRQTLAASIGEIARIIGPENSRSDLIYRWWDFVRGHDAVVRAKALEALETFLQALDQQDRVRLVYSLEEIWDNHLKRWREREVLARTLARLAPFFPSNGQSLRTILGRALRDETAAVRTAAVEAVSMLFKSFSEISILISNWEKYPQIYDCVSAFPGVLRSIVDEILSLAYDEVYKKRLTYVACEKALIAHYRYNERIMDDDFWEAAVALAHDKIVDSRTLPPSVLHIVRALNEDPASDVRDFVSHILTRDVLALSQGVQERVATSTIFSRPPPKRQASEMEVEDTFHRFFLTIFALSSCPPVLPTPISSTSLSNTHAVSPTLLSRGNIRFLIFVGAFGLVVVFPVLFIEVTRRGAVSSRVWFEVSWITLFWVLNLAGAVAGSAVVSKAMCNFTSAEVHHSGPACASARVLVVFSWLNTAFRASSRLFDNLTKSALTRYYLCSLVVLYFVLLMGFVIVHQKEDTGVWYTNVREFSWFETKQCLRSAPNSPIGPGARFVKQKLPSLVAPKPRRPPVFVHQRAGLSSRVEIEHFTDVATIEEQPLPPNPVVVALAASNPFAFYPAHVQTSMQASSTHQNNSYYPSNPGPSPPPIRNWPRPINYNDEERPKSERAAQKQRANSNGLTTASNPRKNGRSKASPPPIAPERSTAVEAPVSPSRSRPTGPRTRSGSSTFVRPRPPPARPDYRRLDA